MRMLPGDVPLPALSAMIPVGPPQVVWLAPISWTRLCSTIPLATPPSMMSLGENDPPRPMFHMWLPAKLTFEMFGEGQAKILLPIPVSSGLVTAAPCNSLSSTWMLLSGLHPDIWYEPCQTTRTSAPRFHSVSGPGGSILL